MFAETPRISTRGIKSLALISCYTPQHPSTHRAICRQASPRSQRWLLVFTRAIEAPRRVAELFGENQRRVNFPGLTRAGVPGIEKLQGSYVV